MTDDGGDVIGDDGDAMTPEPDDKAYLRERAKKEAVSWVKETASGIASALAVLLFGMVLVQVGLAQEGQGFEFSAFAPLEFWDSFRGLVIQWSEFNEWVLLGIGVLFAALTAVVFLRWRRKRAAAAEPETTDDAPRLRRLEAKLATLKSVGVFGLLTAITISAYLYQQYLWNVVLPIDESSVGVAFSRQVGSSVASDQLADFLRQHGHEDSVQMRELPVRFDARDTEKAQAMAKRIGADAVVIFRPPGADESTDATAQAGMFPLAASGNEAEESSVTYIVFADPSVGVEIPVPQRSAEGEPKGVVFRPKEGLETPRLEATDVGRLMEATAGILMYNEDRTLQAIAHLRNSLGDGTAQADAIVNFYLGNAYYLIDDPNAQQHLATAAALLEKSRLGIQERLLLVAAYTESAGIAFYDGRLRDARGLLQKAVALREPIDKDENALADPTTYRRFHETYANVYLRLMDLNIRLGDRAAVDLWRTRAREEGEALAGRTDLAAQLGAVFVDYRTGRCSAAYKAAQQLRAENPENPSVYRVLMRLAYLRDGAFTGIESKLRLDTVLKLAPDNLNDLQSQVLYWSLRKYVDDPAFALQERKSAERILEVDPSNVGAIAGIVQSADLLMGLQFNDGTALVRPTGHEPTFAALQEQRRRDPEQLRILESEVAELQPYVVRWAEEIQPGSVEPLVYRASLSASLANWYYNYAFINPLYDPSFRPKPEVVQRYEKIFAKAAADGKAALASKRGGDPRVWLLLYKDLIDLWVQRSFVVDEDSPERDEVVANIEAITERAEAVLRDDLTDSPRDNDLAATTYVPLLTAYATLKNYYTDAGDEQAAARYEHLVNDVTLRFAQLSAGSIEHFRDLEIYLTRRVCPEGARKTKAQELIHRNPEKAATLLVEYTKAFPTDPEGLIDLGWAQYLTGDLEAAATTTRRAQDVAPSHALPPMNLAIIAAAQGDTAAAQERTADALTVLDQLPLTSRLNNLHGFAGDLLTSARDREPSRESVSAVVARVQTYLDELPDAKRGLHGAMYVSVLNRLGGAAIWAGDIDVARDLLGEALDVWPQIAIVHVNLMVAAVVEGDRVTALAETAKAGEAARSYLRDFYGEPLADDALDSRRTLARQELITATEVLAELVRQQPGVAEDAAAVSRALHRELATLD